LTIKEGEKAGPTIPRIPETERIKIDIRSPNFSGFSDRKEDTIGSRLCQKRKYFHSDMHQKQLNLSAFFLFAFFTALCAATSPQPVPKLFLQYVKKSAPKVAHKKAASARIGEDDSLFLEVRVELPIGWHINSETPPDSFLVPTRIEASAPEMLFGKPRFPKPEMVFSPAMGEKLPLYSGVFTVQIPVQRKSNTQPDLTPVPGTTVSNRDVTRATLHYQACNDSMCLPPKDVTVELASDGVKN
jgi:hypothetical protein